MLNTVLLQQFRTIATLEATGDGSGVATLQMQASRDTTLTLSGDGNFYTDAAGTTGESKTWTITAGALRTIYIRLASGTCTLTIPDKRLITQWGNSVTGSGWAMPANAPKITFSNSLAVDLPYLNQLYLASIQITITGSMPALLRNIYMYGNNISWTYNGALPTGLAFLNVNGSAISWTYNGSMPALLKYMILLSNNISWTYNGALPTGLTYLDLNGNSISWNGFDVSGTGNITTFRLNNFVTTSMTAAQLITLLTSMAGRTGNLPATCTVLDYSNPAGATATDIRDAVANVAGTDAQIAKYWIEQIFATKATTTIALQGVNIVKP